jgi:hypothetical protein
VNEVDSAVPSATSGTTWSTEAPVQLIVVERWNVTLPVGAGTPAGTPAAFSTNTLSCTIVPVRTDVTALWFESWMSVRTVESAQSFVAGPELAPVASVLRVSVTPPTTVVTCALTTVVPGVVETRLIVQVPVAPSVGHGLTVVNAPGPESIVKPISVPAGALTKPEPVFTLTCAVKTWVAPTGLVAVGGLIWMLASTTCSGSHGPSDAA